MGFMTEIITPLGNKVAVQLSDAEQMVGGIIVPTGITQEVSRGIVSGLGEGILDLNGKYNPIATLEIGDTVIVDKKFGREVAKGIFIFEYENIMAKVSLPDDDEDEDDD